MHFASLLSTGKFRTALIDFWASGKQKKKWGNIAARLAFRFSRENLLANSGLQTQMKIKIFFFFFKEFDFGPPVE